jgi:hypothetical protein
LRVKIKRDMSAAVSCDSAASTQPSKLVAAGLGVRDETIAGLIYYFKQKNVEIGFLNVRANEMRGLTARLGNCVGES